MRPSFFGVRVWPLSDAMVESASESRACSHIFSSAVIVDHLNDNRLPIILALEVDR